MSFFYRCLWARLFVKCSSSAEAAVARHDSEKARQLLAARLSDCMAEESRIERQLMNVQTQLRLLASNLETDPYPDVLMHRIKVSEPYGTTRPTLPLILY